MRILLGRHLNAGTRDNRRLRPSFGALLRVPLLLDAPLVFAAPLQIGSLYDLRPHLVSALQHGSTACVVAHGIENEGPPPPLSQRRRLFRSPPHRSAPSPANGRISS